MYHNDWLPETYLAGSVLPSPSKSDRRTYSATSPPRLALLIHVLVLEVSHQTLEVPATYLAGSAALSPSKSLGVRSRSR